VPGLVAAADNACVVPATAVRVPVGERWKPLTLFGRRRSAPTPWILRCDADRLRAARGREIGDQETRRGDAEHRDVAGAGSFTANSQR